MIHRCTSLLLRFGIPALVLGLSIAIIEPRVQYPVANWVFRMGDRAGCQYFMSGGLFMTPSGPFLGNDLKTRSFNLAYRYLPYVVALAPGLAGALVVNQITTVRGNARARRRDGTTRCGPCGYVLSGLREPVCPECGHAI